MTNESEVTEQGPEEPKKPASRKAKARKKAKSKVAEPAKAVDDPAPRPASEPTPVPAPAPSQPAASPQVRRVTLRNRRGQLLTPSVLNERGEQETLRIPAYGHVEIVEDRITDYTRNLVAQGHLSIDSPR